MEAEYGIWSDVNGDWLVLSTGEVFHTTSLFVARAELHHIARREKSLMERLQYYVRRFDSRDEKPGETHDQIPVYSIWNHTKGIWFILGDGEVFHTIYRPVAEATLQYAKMFWDGSEFSMRELPLAIQSEDVS